MAIHSDSVGKWLRIINIYIIYLCVSVDKSGDVCISILHDPGEDKYGYERPEERWLPIHTVETILVSVISMLADPNDESPANLDAAVSNHLCMSETKSESTTYAYLKQKVRGDPNLTNA